MTALTLTGLTKSFGKAQIIRDVDLTVQPGERHAVIGPNGAGKSTLFDLITGRTAPSSGSVWINGQDTTGVAPHRISRLGVSRSFQITNIFPRLSVFENVRCALLWSEGYRYACWRLLDRDRRLNHKADDILRRLDLHARRDLPAGVLAYADQRALEIGITVACGASVILLDEPTAGMSRAESDAMVALIRDVTVGKTLIMVEHDMGVVFELADRITVLAYGRVIATGTPEDVRANAAVQEAYLGELERS